MSKFSTITADDWRRAIARGRSEGNAVLDQIRARVAKLNYQRTPQAAFCDWPQGGAACAATFNPMDNETNQITEAQVASFMLAKVAELSAACGDQSAKFDVCARKDAGADGECRIEYEAYIHGGAYCIKQTIAGAFKECIAKNAPAEKAKALRASAGEWQSKAAALLADAAKLEGVAS